MIDLRKPDLRIAPVGTVVISTKGFEFELLERDDKGKETWLDKTSGLKWFDVEDETMSHVKAMDTFCEVSKRLPTKEEFEAAEDHGFRDVLPNMSDFCFWSASVHPNNSDYAYGFNGYSGYIDFASRYYINDSVRCVGR